MRKLLLLAVLLLTTPAFATTYYTAKLCSGGSGPPPNCTDANNGTSRATAELTIAAGLAHLAAGDTLIIGDGTYSESIANLVPDGVSNGVRTIIQAENRRAVTLNGATATYNNIFQIENRQFITVDGLVFDGLNSAQGGVVIGDSVSGVGGTGSSYITIQNSEVKNITETGILSHNAGTTIKGSNVSILNNIVHHIGVSGTPTGFDAHGIYPHWSDSLIEGNTVSNVGDSTLGGVAIHQYFNGNGGMDNNIYRKNICYANYGGCLLIADGTAQVYNNVIYGNALKNEGCGGIFVDFQSSNTEIYFNTIYGNNGAAICLRNVDGVIHRNNIYYTNGTDGVSNFSGVTGTVGSNNLTTDPSFVCGSNCATNPDFHLFSTSAALPPCGTNIASVTTDKDGITRPNPPSCGAYEVPSGVDPGSDVSEDFESYAATTNINGLNGGTGWTQAWQVASGTATVETTSCLTGKAFTTSTTSYVDTRRLFAGKTGDFTIQAKICLSIANPDNAMAFNILDQSGTEQAAIGFNGTNLVSYAEAANVTLISGFSANTPYTLRFHFDTVNHANQVQFGIGSAEYGAWENTVSPFTSMAGVFINNYATNAHVFSVDDINDDAGPPMLPPPPTTNVGIRARMRAR